MFRNTGPQRWPKPPMVRPGMLGMITGIQATGFSEFSELVQTSRMLRCIQNGCWNLEDVRRDGFEILWYTSLDIPGAILVCEPSHISRCLPLIVPTMLAMTPHDTIYFLGDSIPAATYSPWKLTTLDLPAHQVPELPSRHLGNGKEPSDWYVASEEKHVHDMIIVCIICCHIDGIHLGFINSGVSVKHGACLEFMAISHGYMIVDQSKLKPDHGAKRSLHQTTYHEKKIIKQHTI